MIYNFSGGLTPTPRLNELKLRFCNVRESVLKQLIAIENEQPFSCNKWYCFLCSIVAENFKTKS